MLPTAGVVVLDTAPLIYLIERHPKYAARLEPLWRSAERGEVFLLVSELALSEALVLPLREENARLVMAYELLMREPGIRVEPVDWPVLRRASELRASKPSLRMPDAMHLATADLAKCEVFVTNDKSLRGLATLNVVVIDDLTD
jgi:predicted nucleic acid-binding protein